MSTIGERIRDLRNARNLTLKDLSLRANISISFLSDIESGRTRPSVDTLLSLANALGVPTDYLLGKTGLAVCPVCGLQYVIPEDCAEHEKVHEAYLAAVEKFGPIMHYRKREALKGETQRVLKDSTTTLTAKIEAAEKLLRAYFSSSVESNGFSLRHPPFEEYAAMLLNQNYWRQTLGIDVYNALVSKYGRQPGIEEGLTYWKPDACTQKYHRAKRTFSKGWGSLLDAIPVGERIKIPVIGVVKAGPNGIAYEEHLDEEWADKDSLNGAKHYFLKVKGDSMIGDGILPGDLALVREQPDVESGQIAVVIIDKEEGTIKRVIKTNNSIVLQASNPLYPPRVFSGSELERIRIVGRVKEINRKY